MTRTKQWSVTRTNREVLASWTCEHWWNHHCIQAQIVQTKRHTRPCCDFLCVVAEPNTGTADFWTGLAIGSSTVVTTRFFFLLSTSPSDSCCSGYRLSNADGASRWKPYRPSWWIAPSSFQWSRGSIEDGSGCRECCSCSDRGSESFESAWCRRLQKLVEVVAEAASLRPWESRSRNLSVERVELDIRAVHFIGGPKVCRWHSKRAGWLGPQCWPSGFLDAEKQRNTFFYSMIASLLRQRALLVVRQVTGCNGLEAYRTLILQNEPVSKNRSMGLLNVKMNWPTFSNKMSQMQNVLKLEHAYSEYEKLGSRLNDDLKTAILMRGVTGQLKSLASTAGQRGHNLQQGQRDDFALWHLYNALEWADGSWRWWGWNWRWPDSNGDRPDWEGQRKRRWKRKAEGQEWRQRQKARENRKEKVIVKANRKVVTRRASKVVLVTDPREKGRQTANSVKIADAVDALPKTVGNSRYVQFLRATLDNHQMLAQLSSQLCRDLKVLLQVGASRRWHQGGQGQQGHQQAGQLHEIVLLGLLKTVQAIWFSIWQLVLVTMDQCVWCIFVLEMMTMVTTAAPTSQLEWGQLLKRFQMT